MRTLIVQSNEDLGNLWKDHLIRLGADVSLALTSAQAYALIQVSDFDVIVLDLVLSDSGALVVADFANFRQPEANVVFVTDTTFFSDGSIFHHAANARAFVEKAMPARDLAEIVNHYGQTPPDRAVRPAAALG